MEWQDISTAPKDGTEILSWKKDCGFYMIRWTSPDAFLTQSEMEAEGMTDEDMFAEGWFGADWNHGFRIDESELPTHWCLPEAPK